MPIATGGLAIAGVAGIAIPILSLTSAATTSGINISAQDFLFGVDNIDDVRTLIENALAAHENSVTAQRASFTEIRKFDWVV